MMRTSGARIASMVAAMSMLGCREDAVSVGAESTGGSDPAGTTDASGSEGPEGTDIGDTGEADDGVELLTPVEHLVRASLALRGIRPGLDELRRVAEDPDALPGLVDAYLQSDAFGITIRDLHNEALLLRADVRPDLFYYPKLAALELPAEISDVELSRTVNEAPLRLIEHVVMNDLPYTEIVTADYTIADRTTAAVWGLPWDPDGEALQRTWWPDDRPAAGILSDSAMFHRHKRLPNNQNRGRANAISAALLCLDYLDEDIAIDSNVDLSDEDAILHAVRNDPACAACHSGLDPLASYFFGHDVFHLVQEFDAYPLRLYQSAAEPQWMYTNEQPPALFGEPGDRLDDLGRQIADSPLFASCAVRRFSAYLLQQPLEDIDDDAVDVLAETFVESGFDARVLIRDIVLSDRFAVAHSTDMDEAETLVGIQRLRPRQLSRMVEDLTGFRWEIVGVPNFAPASEPMPPEAVVASKALVLEQSLLGYEMLAGGIDSYYATEPAFTVNPTTMVVLQQLAGLAARYVVDDDFARPKAERRLLTKVDAADRDESLLREQLADLHLRILAEDFGPHADAVDESLALFAGALDRGGDTHHAWTVTLTALLQDVRSIHY